MSNQRGNSDWPLAILFIIVIIIFFGGPIILAGIATANHTSPAEDCMAQAQRLENDAQAQKEAYVKCLEFYDKRNKQ